MGRAGIIAEADAFWGARAGIEFLRNHHIMVPDTFTWIAAGKKWTPNSWGWNALLGAMWQWIGYSGFAVVVFIGCIVIFGTLVAQSYRRGASPQATGFACVIGMIGLSAWLSPRAHLGTLVAALVIIALTDKALRTQSQRQVAMWSCAIAGAEAVAINSHFGALSIVPVVASACGVWLFTAVRVSTRRTGDVVHQLIRAFMPVIAVTIGSFMNPLGTGVIAHGAYVHSQSVGLVPEWKPGFETLTSSAVILFGIAGCVLAFRARRPVTAGAIACAVVLTISASRFQALTVATVVPELAVVLTPPFHQRQHYLKTPLRVAAVVFSLAVLPTAVGAVVHPGRPASKEFSIAAVQALPQNCRAFNNDLDGGLIDLIRPDVKVSTDGRNDLIGKSAIKEQLAVWKGRTPNGTTWLDSHGITCVIVGNTKSFRPLLQELSRSPQWKPIFATGHHWVFVPVANDKPRVTAQSG